MLVLPPPVEARKSAEERAPEVHRLPREDAGRADENEDAGRVPRSHGEERHLCRLSRPGRGERQEGADKVRRLPQKGLTRLRRGYGGPGRDPVTGNRQLAPCNWQTATRSVASFGLQRLRPAVHRRDGQDPALDVDRVDDGAQGGKAGDEPASGGERDYAAV